MSELFGLSQAKAWRAKIIPPLKLPEEEYTEKPFMFDIETHIWDGRHRSRVPILDAFLKGVELRTAWYRMETKCDLTYQTLDQYMREMFVESECDMAFTCSLQEMGLRKPEAERYVSEPEDMAAAQKRYPNRNIATGLIQPTIAGDEGIEYIEDQVKRLGIRAWAETYNYVQKPNAPRGQRVVNWRYDDEKRVYPVLEKLVELDAPILCPASPRDADGRSDWSDVSVAAKNFPELTFIIYHFGGIYYKSAASSARSNKNVYMGWNGKHDPLRSVPEVYIEHFGEVFSTAGADKILWGTDWPATGHMQFQIEACKAFQFSKEMRLKHALPELTEEDKRKMFGLNMAEILKKYGFIESLEDQRKKIKEDEFSQRAGKILPALKAKYKRVLRDSQPWWTDPDHWMRWRYDEEESLSTVEFGGSPLVKP